MKNILNYSVVVVLLISLGFLHSCKEADPTIQFVISRNTADVGEEIEFTNGTQGAATYEWDFGDGTSSTEENPKKKYSKPGKFIVTLTGITKKKKIEKSKSLEIQINSIEEYCKGNIDGAAFEFTLDDANTTAAFTSNLNLT
ncbi:MAG: PKD domain-containing protein, partial [Bacteroidia bacterium]